MKHLFVTGMPRSGTTLVDKVLSLHERIRVLSQPLPLLYVALKRAFLRRKGRPQVPYPLNDMFGDLWYDSSEFVRDLDEHPPSADFYRATMERMIGFDGQYTRPHASFCPPYDARSVLDFVVGCWGGFQPDASELDVLGSKETWCEELIPYYLAHGAHVILVMRDPRDIVASLNHGDGQRFGGPAKPHLWNVRQWRKSVAFALAFGNHPRLHVLRFEDLVTEPIGSVRRMTDFLGVEPFADSVLTGELRSQEGETWRSNSSHRPMTTFDPRAVGRYRQHLAGTTDHFIQATCYAEMCAMGYPLDLEVSDVSEVLAAPVAEVLHRQELTPYLWTPPRQAEEAARFEAMHQGEYLSRLFLFEKAFLALRRIGGRTTRGSM